MYLNVDMDIATDYDVIDVISGIRIPRVYEADDKTGKFSMYLMDENGDFINKDKNIVLLKVKGNIKIVRKEKSNV